MTREKCNKFISHLYLYKVIPIVHVIEQENEMTELPSAEKTTHPSNERLPVFLTKLNI